MRARHDQAVGHQRQRLLVARLHGQRTAGRLTGLAVAPQGRQRLGTPHQGPQVLAPQAQGLVKRLQGLRRLPQQAQRLPHVEQHVRPRLGLLSRYQRERSARRLHRLWGLAQGHRHHHPPLPSPRIKRSQHRQHLQALPGLVPPLGLHMRAHLLPQGAGV